MLSDELKGNGTMCWNVPKMKEIMIMLTCYLHKEEKNSVFLFRFHEMTVEKVLNWYAGIMATSWNCRFFPMLSNKIFYAVPLFWEREEWGFFFNSRFEVYWLSSSATHLYKEKKHWLVSTFNEI